MTAVYSQRQQNSTFYMPTLQTPSSLELDEKTDHPSSQFSARKSSTSFHTTDDAESGSDDECSSLRSPLKRRSSENSGQRKKAGRRAITETPVNKRIAQNRQAQRAFRERKEAYLHGLEAQVVEQAKRIEELVTENSMLKELAVVSASRNDTAMSIVSPATDFNFVSFPSPASQQQKQQLSGRVSSVDFNSFSDMLFQVEQEQQQQQQPQQQPQQQKLTFVNSPVSNYSDDSMHSNLLQQAPSTDTNIMQLFAFHNTPPSLPQQLVEAMQQFDEIFDSLLSATRNSQPSQLCIVPEFQAEMDSLDFQIDTAGSLTPVSIPHLACMQRTLKALPSLHKLHAIVDEMCECFTAFAAKCCSQGLPNINDVTVSGNEQFAMIHARELLLGTCNKEDFMKAEVILEIAKKKHRAHYERLVRNWDFAVCANLIDF
ncbi:hypothetical protein HK100_001227 [Physocladia obscura]|uniref:Putative transcription factor kapC n=1 Tax=Physocladia obscura TaxID=109957 RepID=A0AAD5SY82_9FUNG|nr:hypothetical protein HK100_001227 [Physocladia obscura]